MEITMSEVESIQKTLEKHGDSLHNLDKRMAVADQILDSIQETQKGIARILENQSMQKEKNKSFSDAISKNEAKIQKVEDALIDKISKVSDKASENKSDVRMLTLKITLVISAMVFVINQAWKYGQSLISG